MKYIKKGMKNTSGLLSTIEKIAENITSGGDIK